jgi:hypothetical protein
VNGSASDAAAVSAVDHSSMRLCPNMSPSFAKAGTTSAESMSCVPSSQFTSASCTPRCRAMSVSIGV